MAVSVTDSICYHCGDSVLTTYSYKDKVFCCNGCQSVYQIISDSGLDRIYNGSSKLSKPQARDNDVFVFLKHDEIASSFYEYSDDECTHVSLILPSIHCSSCVWLLENLHLVDNRIGQVEVNLTQRRANIVFDHKRISLYELAVLLASFGYPPNFSRDQKDQKSNNNKFYAKLGVAAFCFGNIMLFSFPEYLNFDEEYVINFRNFFSILILCLSIPLLLYSAIDYLKSGYLAIKTRIITLDVSISLGIIALFCKSLFDIITGNGPGYMDSFAAFIFLLLIGKWFQNYTYDNLSFENNIETYLPMVVMRIKGDLIEMIKLDEIVINDTLLLKKGDVIPVDAFASDDMLIDYSFVTGESDLKKVFANQKIYVGGRIVSDNAKIKVACKLDSDGLRRMWGAGKKNDSKEINGSIRVLSGYFLKVVLLIALLAAVFWFFIDPQKSLFVFVSVLIVACPCALALSMPFTVGNASRLFGKNKLYVKDANRIPVLGQITTIVFDKTGTLTSRDNSGNSNVVPEQYFDEIYTAASLSGHPKSRALVIFLQPHDPKLKNVTYYKEFVGEGTETLINDNFIRIGSDKFVSGKSANSGATQVSVNGTLIFEFNTTGTIIEGLDTAIPILSGHYDLKLISGDNDRDYSLVKNLGFADSSIHFNMTAADKGEFIDKLQANGEKVLMIGDGLNDVHALNKADFGIAVTDQIHGFIPGCDAILESDQLKNIGRFLNTGLRTVLVLRLCFLVSIVYNLVGLYFAITGQLSPFIAAVLMPVSSITIVLLTTVLLRKMRNF